MKDYTGIDLDDIVFEGRNRQYGAYVLRKLNDDFVLRAAAITSLIFILAVVGPVVWDKIKPEEEIVEEEILPVDLKNIAPPPPIDPKIPPPPPLPAAPPPPKVSTIRFVPPEVAPDEEVVEKDPPKQEDLKDVQTSTVTQEGDPNADPNQLVIEGEPGGTGTGVAEPAVEEIFQVVEQMPEFPGGNAEMIKFMQREIKYPEAARRSETQGRVYVSFVVSQDGSLSDIKAERGPGFGLDEEAVRVVKKMPKWNPGQNNGRSVKVRMVIPVNFRLN